MIPHDVVIAHGSRTLVLDLQELGAIPVAWMLSSEIGNVRGWPCGDIARQTQLGNERPSENLFPGVHVRDALHEQIAASDLDLVAFLEEALEIRATTYQFLRH